MTAPAPRRSRLGATLFVVLSLAVLAAVAYWVYLRPSPEAARSPEDTVRAFLGAVFDRDDPAQLDGVICSGWDPQQAVSRTWAQFPAGSHISWDTPAVVTAVNDKTTLRANLGVRQPDDKQISYHEAWRFSLVDESGWKVCDAAPVNPS